MKYLKAFIVFLVWWWIIGPLAGLIFYFIFHKLTPLGSVGGFVIGVYFGVKRLRD